MVAGERTGNTPEPSGTGAAGTAAGAHPAAELIARLARRADAMVEDLVPATAPFALLDFPHMPNVGDSAIWMGTLACLRRIGRPAPRYTCSNRTFDADLLRRHLPHGTILLSGGGNFGDLYEPHQRLREEVIRAFPDHTIVQLPQTLHFASREALDRARQVFRSHRSFTLLARDEPSLALARDPLGVASRLCPDMSFCLGPLARIGEPEHDTVWLSRRDREAAVDGDPLAPPSVHRVDWPRDPQLPFEAGYRLLSREVRRRRPLRAPLQPILSRAYEPVARARVRRGCRILSSGRRVITDRLHGHILCLLLGIPHFVLDNSYGKVRAFHECWTRESELGRWCDSPAEALALATGDAQPLPSSRG